MILLLKFCEGELVRKEGKEAGWGWMEGLKSGSGSVSSKSNKELNWKAGLGLKWE